MKKFRTASECCRSFLTCLLFVSAVSGYYYMDEEDPQKATTSCNCGWTNKARIVGGWETGKNEYPYMSALVGAKDGEQFCGGSVLTQRHVLTAGHCISDKRPEDVLIAVGAHDLDKKHERYRKLLKVEKIILHEKYQSNGYENNDISILVTSEPIPFNKNIGPVCLPNKRVQLDSHLVKILGWGLTSADGDKASPVLREVDVRVMPMKECSLFWNKDYLSGQAQQICTHSKGKDSCNVDSGGPLLWQDPDLERYVIVGLVSFGDKCAGMKPAVNTDVSFYIDWIDRHVRETYPQLHCCQKVN